MNSVLALAFLLLGATPHRVDTLNLPDGSKAGLWIPGGKGRKPLVVWLHGGIGANNPAKGVAAAANMAATWGDSGAFALVAPSAWPASPWWGQEAVGRLEAVVAAAARNRGVDPDRIVVAGVSDGGSGSLWLSSRLRAAWGKRLKGVAVWSTDPDVLSMQGADWNPSSLRGLALRWTAGGRDRLYPLERVRLWWGECERQGVLLERHEDPQADHDLSFHQADLARFPAWVRRVAK